MSSIYLTESATGDFYNNCTIKNDVGCYWEPYTEGNYQNNQAWTVTDNNTFSYGYDSSPSPDSSDTMEFEVKYNGTWATQPGPPLGIPPSLEPEDEEPPKTKRQEIFRLPLKQTFKFLDLD
jgi:hypothetical protein